MTTSLASDDLAVWPRLTGQQEPMHLLVDEGDYTEADKALELGRRMRKPRMPWQRDNVRALLALDPDTNNVAYGFDGKPVRQWLHGTCVEVIPRQNGKSDDVELRMIYGAFILGEHVLYTAQRWATAKSIYNRVMRLIKSRPSLMKRLARPPKCSQGVAEIELVGGAFIYFYTRSEDLGRGLDIIDLTIYDEAYSLQDAHIAGLAPAQLASKRRQAIYLSSAVNIEIHHYGDRLAKLRNRALAAIRAGQRRIGIYYREHAAPVPGKDATPAERKRIREDPETARVANPSYGVIQDDAKMRALLIELGERNYEVECLGWGDWPVDRTEIPSEIPRDKWQAMGPKAENYQPPVLTGSIVIGLQRAGEQTWSVSAAQYTTTGKPHLEVRQVTAPMDEVVKRLEVLVTEWNPAALVLANRARTGEIVPLLIKAGIEPHVATTGDVSRSCGGFLTAALELGLSHSGQLLLDTAADSAVKKQLPRGDFEWDDTVGASYPDLMSVSLAHGGLLMFAKPPRKPLPPMGGDFAGGGGDDFHEFAIGGLDESYFDALNAAF